MLQTLDEIGLRHGTDKSSLHHDYLAFYETFFAPLRHERLNILEIGVLGGRSLRTWAEYFEQARIVGFDINRTTKQFATDRITVEIADQSNIQHLTRIAHTYGPFDIVIEDGSHFCEHQITTLRTLFPFVTDRGIYIVEDLQTNYGGLLDTYRGNASTTCVEFLKRWQDLLVGFEQLPIDVVEDAFLRTYARKTKFMVFHKHACLIKKDWFETETDKVKAIGGSLSSRPLPLAITAHLSNIGDVQVDDGCINHKKHGAASSRVFEIQGLSMSSGLDILEYKILDSDGAWCDWAQEDTFLGTRFQSRLLRGIAVRVRGDAAERYSVRTTCLFRGMPEPREAIDGEEIFSAPECPVYGLQVDLIERHS